MSFYISTSTIQVPNATSYVAPFSILNVSVPTVMQSCFGGAFNDRMNYNSFNEAFITIFNVMFFNNWYYNMIQYCLEFRSFAGVGSFYMIVVVICNYFLTATLMSSVANVLEGHADNQLLEEAAANKAHLDRLNTVRTRLLILAYFKRFKANTIESEDAKKQAQLTTKISVKASNNHIADIEEDEPPQNALDRYIISHTNHSFYLFTPVVFETVTDENGIDRAKVIGGYFRHYSKVFMESKLFAGLMWVATMAAVALALTDNKLGNSPLSLVESLNWFTLAMFLGEMFLKWIEMGFNKYFYVTLNCVDFANNVGMIMATVAPQYLILTQFRIIRLIKFPEIIRSFSSSKSLNLLIDTIYTAPGSVGNLVFVCAIFVYFFSVIALQTWMGALGSCSDPNYPPTQEKDHASVDYPNGCSGFKYVENVALGYSENTEINWVNPLSNFNNIASSMQACFRVFLQSEWLDIVYQTVDSVGYDLQPEKENSTSSFLFFLPLAYLSLTMGVMFLAVVYYHFTMITMKSGRKITIGANNAMWNRIEERLRTVPQRSTNVWESCTIPPQGTLRFYLFRTFRGKKYNQTTALMCIAPMMCMIVLFAQTYASQRIVYYDVVLSMMYITEYVLRIYAIGITATLNSTAMKQEFVCVLTVFAACVYLSPFMDTRNEMDSNAQLALRTCAILRCYRLFSVSESFSLIAKTFKQSLSGIIPTFCYLLVFILIYAVLGVVIMGETYPDYGHTFLDQRFNFNNYFNAAITLTSVATGNMYTKVKFEMKEGASNGMMSVIVEIYFITFAICAVVIIKSFALMIISKYISSAGGALGLAGEQIRQFKTVWFNVVRSKPVGNISHLKAIVSHLEAPLGVLGKTSKLVLVERYMKKILLAMPSSSHYFDEFDVKKQRFIYTQETLPNNVWDCDLEFTFTQMLIAVHKNMLNPESLQDEEEFKGKRAVAKSRTIALRNAFGRLLVIENIAAENQGTPKVFEVSAYRALLLLQRLEPEEYKREFLSVMDARITSIETLIYSLGFGPYVGWVMSMIRGCIKREEHGAKLREKVAKRLASAMFNKNAGKKLRNEAFLYHKNVRILLFKVNKIYNEFVKQNWDCTTLYKVHDWKLKKGIQSIYVDTMSSIYVASGKQVTIYSNVSNGAEVTKNTRFKKMRPLKCPHVVKSVIASDDGKRLYVGCGTDVLVYSLEKFGRHGVQYKEKKQLQFHTGAVSNMYRSRKFLVSAALDYNICLWNLQTDTCIKNFYTGSPIFCSTIMQLFKEEPKGGDCPVTEVVACGLKSGLIQVLPLPISTQRETANMTWGNLTIDTHEPDCPVSCICSAWQYLYAGFADGSVKTWAVIITIDAEASAQPMFSFNQPSTISRMLSFVLVADKSIHSGPVTGMQNSGESLFCASHDLSYVPLCEPESLFAKSPNYFFQEEGRGVVLHTDHINALSGNKYCLVGGDSAGHVLVRECQD